MERFKVYSPTRVDLAGGTLDIWPLYGLVEGAKTINCALDMHAIAEFEISPAKRLKFDVVSPHKENFSFEEVLPRSTIEKLPPTLQFPVFVLNEFLRGKPGIEAKQIKVHIASQAPLRSGLGGSSALCVAMARGLSRLSKDFGEQGWQWTALNWVKDVEAAFIKVPTGTQDYLASLFGGLKCYHSRAGGIDVTDYPTDVFNQFKERALVLFSGEMHASGLSNWEIIRGAIENDKRVIEGLTQIKLLADQLDGELRGHISWKHVGAFLTEEWNLRKNAFNVRTERLEQILEHLRDQKVLGAKVCGAAQGGSILAIVDPAKKVSLTYQLQEAGIQVLGTSPNPQAVHFA